MKEYIDKNEYHEKEQKDEYLVEMQFWMFFCMQFIDSITNQSFSVNTEQNITR